MLQACLNGGLQKTAHSAVPIEVPVKVREWIRLASSSSIVGINSRSAFKHMGM
jgi:hypothetical protein